MNNEDLFCGQKEKKTDITEYITKFFYYFWTYWTSKNVSIDFILRYLICDRISSFIKI